MATNLQASQPTTVVDNMFNLAFKVPNVKVDRYTFLRTELKYHCDAADLERAIACPPQVVSADVLERIAKSVVNAQRTFVTVNSFISGLPGGALAFATIPADVAQYFANLLIIVQKLAYLYGYDDFTDDGKVTEHTRHMLTIMLGVAFGVKVAQKAMNDFALQLSKQAALRIPRIALTKTIFYPIVKQVAKALGIKITKRSFGGAVAKFFPIAGGLVNGALTFASFGQTAHYYRRHMAQHPALHDGSTPFYVEEAAAADDVQTTTEEASSTQD